MNEKAFFHGAPEKFAVFSIFSIEITMSRQMLFQKNGAQSSILIFYAADSRLQERRMIDCFQIMQKGGWCQTCSYI